MQKQEKQRAVFLDRDGTINVEKDYLYQISDFEYMDGALEGLKELSDMGYLLVVVTNQSGIARGYYKEQDYLNLEKWMCEDLRSKGIPIARCYFCPHLPDGVIPENKYLVMGDNRPESQDSRDKSFGLVDKSDIKGKVFFRIWPFGGI